MSFLVSRYVLCTYAFKHVIVNLTNVIAEYLPGEGYIAYLP